MFELNDILNITKKFKDDVLKRPAKINDFHYNDGALFALAFMIDMLKRIHEKNIDDNALEHEKDWLAGQESN